MDISPAEKFPKDYQEEWDGIAALYLIRLATPQLSAETASHGNQKPIPQKHGR
jgi:hypothetical protein